MTKKELAVFLGVSSRRIETLWDEGRLRRTVSHPDRSSVWLSSAFDALEYGLTSGALAKRLSHEKAELWVTCLARVVEHEVSFRETQPEQRARELYCYVGFEGPVELTSDSVEIACIIVTEYQRILQMMAKTDENWWKG